MGEWSELASGVAGGGLVIAVQMGKQKWDDARDSKRIYNWLVSEFAKSDKYKHRSTRAIAKEMNLTPERVATLCHNHRHIKHALGTEEGLWSLDGSDQTSQKGFFG
ncbi:hypothetical protein [Pseudomonas sp.]|uniref:hypothetical protein n=1 Tax=Pseudomonas sp. TaxID=306 RepID=UPI003D14ADB9